MTHDLVSWLRACATNEPSNDDAAKLWDAADKLEAYMADADAHVSRLELVRRQEDEIRDLKAENAALRAERDSAFAMSKCECGADEACANLARLRAEKDEMRKALERIAAMWGTAGSEKGLPCRITDLNGTRESHTSTGVFASDVARQALAAIRNMGGSE